MSKIKSLRKNFFGANRKRVCDFLLGRNSNLGPILHHFGDMTAFMCSWSHLYSTVIWGVPVVPSPMPRSMNLVPIESAYATSY